MRIGAASWVVTAGAALSALCVFPAMGLAQVVVDGWTAEQQLMAPPLTSGVSAFSDDIFGQPGRRDASIPVPDGFPATTLTVGEGTMTFAKDAGAAVQVDLRYDAPGVETVDLTSGGATGLVFPAEEGVIYRAVFFVDSVAVFGIENVDGDFLIPYDQLPMGVDLTEVSQLRLQVTLGQVGVPTPAAMLVSSSPFRTVPEPSGGLLAGSSIASLGWLAGRRRRGAATERPARA